MDLTTTYLGLTLRSPLVASASPVTARLDALRAVADSGVGAVVLPSLFEEQVRQQELADLAVQHGLIEEAPPLEELLPE